MRYCPNCKNAYDTDSTCPADGAELVDELPFQTIEGPASTWVEIATARTEDEGRILQGFLEAEGIPCQVESLRFGMEPVNFGTMGEIRIYVSAENGAVANELLRSREKQYAEMRDGETVLTDEGAAVIDDSSEMVPETES